MRVFDKGRHTFITARHQVISSFGDCTRIRFYPYPSVFDAGHRCAEEVHYVKYIATYLIIAHGGRGRFLRVGGPGAHEPN